MDAARPGLQAERTSLAWRRTVMSTVMCAAVVALTVLRLGQVRALAVVVIAGAVAAGVAAAVVWGQRRTGGDGRGPWSMLAVTVGTVVMLALLGAVSAVVAAVLPHA